MINASRPSKTAAALLVATALLLGHALYPEPAQAQRRGRLTKVDISALVDGAEVSIDGAFMGILPLKEPLKLLPGEHTFKVSKRGYTDFIETIKIPRTRKVFLIEADLLPVSGILTIHTRPSGARILIDDQVYGETPFDGEIPEGTRQISVRMNGRVPFVETIDVIAGESYSYDLDLAEAPSSEPFYTTWWFWTGVGAVVAGTVITTVVITAEGEPPTAPGNPRVPLPLRFEF